MAPKQTSRFQPDRSGHHTPVAVNPGMVISHQSHGDAAREPARGGNIARDASRGRHVGPVAVHGGMHRTTGTNIGAPSTVTLDNIPDASNPLAADPTRAGKSFMGKAVPPVPGQRSRNTDGPTGLVRDGISADHERGKGRYADHVALGRAIIGEALASAPGDHPCKLGRR
jgi:hypothetical protein